MRKLLFCLVVGVTAVLALMSGLRGTAVSAQPEVTLGYGFNVAVLDLELLQGMGFNWVKIFSGPGSRLPVNVLVRVDGNASDFADLTSYGNEMFNLAQSQKGWVEAYEIGNEPNLDAIYGWGYGSTKVPPNAADYAQVLCTAYTKIKQADPNAKVISAGLAPTGRVTGNWNGHPGHNGLFQDEREFFKEFLAAGGGNCLDGVGYHPYGFSADYDVAPDAGSADPARNCAPNGFCFRGSEKIYELMQANGLGSKTVWATEFGWLRQPPDDCLSDPRWSGRAWQIVSEQKQADNLAGAFQYAAANWPWMEAMIVFNLNFNTAPWFDECEQMRFYGVAGMAAEGALRDMPKATDPQVGELTVSRTAVSAMITPTQQPFAQTTNIILGNVGDAAIYVTGTVDGGTLMPTVGPLTAVLSPTETAVMTVTMASDGRTTGTYTATLTLSATNGAIGVPVTIPITLFIVDQIHSVYLPVIQKP